mmetsp:Transcript_7791/g.11865  ORF Transcript_7791/g.11865 Transcript_7791/m.11865 type:complete len:227 (+) Transcript_7791:306-986(+)
MHAWRPAHTGDHNIQITLVVVHEPLPVVGEAHELPRGGGREGVAQAHPELGGHDLRLVHRQEVVQAVLHLLQSPREVPHGTHQLHPQAGGVAQRLLQVRAALPRCHIAPGEGVVERGVPVGLAPDAPIQPVLVAHHLHPVLLPYLYGKVGGVPAFGCVHMEGGVGRRNICHVAKFHSCHHPFMLPRAFAGHSLFFSVFIGALSMKFPFIYTLDGFVVQREGWRGAR